MGRRKRFDSVQLQGMFHSAVAMRSADVDEGTSFLAPFLCRPLMHHHAHTAIASLWRAAPQSNPAASVVSRRIGGSVLLYNSDPSD
jgi:hypothetical protein